MTWNWQHPNWPDFLWKSEALTALEQKFLLQSGEFVGAHKHVGPDDQETFKIELISEEAVKTSEIEGEILNRDSVQSSLRQQLGVGAEKPGVDPAERGIAEMMADLRVERPFRRHPWRRKRQSHSNVTSTVDLDATAREVIEAPM